jgi:hypothetical protein
MPGKKSPTSPVKIEPGTDLKKEVDELGGGVKSQDTSKKRKR